MLALLLATQLVALPASTKVQDGLLWQCHGETCVPYESARDGYHPPQSAPRWAVLLGASGPLVDGFSTYWAMGHPNVREGNPFYYRLFGSNVKREEILAFKVAQAAVVGAAIHRIGKTDRQSAVGLAVVSAAVHFLVSALNVRNGMRAEG